MLVVLVLAATVQLPWGVWAWFLPACPFLILFLARNPDFTRSLIFKMLVTKNI